MIVTVNKKGETATYDLPFSIGDIVRVTEFGDRFAEQKYTAEHSTFTQKGLTVNFEHEINKTNYQICNNKFSSVEWRVVDVGYLLNDFFPRREVAVLLRTREKLDMFFVFSNYDRKHGLEIVRKAKKQIENYTININ
jgi:hypothetical protein